MAIRIDQIVDVPQRFVLEPYIAVGGLTLLTGQEGSGKTWFGTWLAALVTQGQGEPWRPQGARAMRDVLWVTAESDPVRLRERLEAQGADLSRIVLADPLTEDVVALIGQHRPGLVVLDPLEDVVVLHGVSADVRRRLLRLVTAARRADAAVLGIRHQTKAKTKDVRASGVGSIAVRAVARSDMVWGRVQHDPDHMIFAHSKPPNDAAPGAAQEFTLAGGRLEWLGESGLKAENVGPPLPQQGAGAGVIERAMDRLSSLLGAQPILADEVYRLCPEFAQRTLREAFSRLGGVRQEQRERGRIVSWWWSLPGVEPPPTDDEPEPPPTLVVLQGEGVAAEGPSIDNVEVEEDPGVARFRLLELDDRPLPPDPGLADDDPGVERFRRLELD